MKRCIDRVGRENVAALVTDNASNMRKARQLLVAMAGYTHIIELRCVLHPCRLFFVSIKTNVGQWLNKICCTRRCYMHAFALVIGSLLGHAWPRQVVSQCQQLVTYFRASHQPLALLREAAKALGIKGGGLQTANKTRFTSVEACITSVQRNEAALRAVVQNHPDAISKAEVKAIVQSQSFWHGVGFLCRLLVPFSQVVGAVQARGATLADLTRYWCFLARTLAGMELDFPDGKCQGPRVNVSISCKPCMLHARHIALCYIDNRTFLSCSIVQGALCPGIQSAGS